MYPPELYPCLTIQSRSAARRAAWDLVFQILWIIGFGTLGDDIRNEINWGSHSLFLDASTLSFRHFVMFCSFLNFKNLWILNLSDSTEREFDSSHNFANSNIFQTRFSHFVFKMENPKFERKGCWSKYMSSFNQKSLCKFILMSFKSLL